MELENAKTNVCNVVINNLHPIILFFLMKIELNKQLQTLFRIENP